MIQRQRPTVPGLRLTNEVRSGPRGSGDQSYIYGAPFGYDNYVRGTLPVGSGRFTIKGAIPEPALFLAQKLTERLRAGGVTIQLPAESHRSHGSGRYATGRLLDEYQSPTLLTLIGRTNLRSNNLYAEAFLRELNKSRGTPTAELADTKVLLEWLAEQGVSTEAVKLEDGSGLATRNFLPARAMTAFLRSQHGRSDWRKTIPLAGRTGSMRGFLKGKTTAGRVYAKSGSVAAVRAYAGYVDRADGRTLAYAIMVNNFTGESKEVRTKMHRLLTGLCVGQLPQ